MNYDEIYDYILEHHGGTFNAYGYNLEDCKRYAVAVYPEFSYTAPCLTVPLVESAFARYRAVFDEPYNGGLGFWYNTDNKQWCIEAVILCSEQRVAEEYAREHRQIAYYHLDCNVPVEQRCIYLEEKS